MKLIRIILIKKKILIIMIINKEYKVKSFNKLIKVLIKKNIGIL